MLTASTEFKEALLYSHRAMTRATLMTPASGGGFVAQPPLAVSEGSLRLDATRNVWRSGGISVAPVDSFDREELAEIDSTCRLVIERGIRFPDNSEEWVTICLAQVQDSALTLSKGAVSLTFSDLGSLVEDYKLITPYVPQDEAGNWMTTVDAIKDLVNLAIVWDDIPGWDIDPSIDQTVKPISTTVFTGSRWGAVTSLAESLGAVVYPKPDGRWAIRSAAIDVDSPVAEFASGRDGIVVDLTRTRQRSEQYNAIPLRWESPSIGGLVFIVDADEQSPTFWNGPFGRRPRDEELNDTISTESQAIAAATALLDQYRGRAASLTFTAVHNPLLEPMDVISVVTDLGTETHVIDSINYPLAGGTMTCQTRLLREEVGDAVI